MVALNGNNAYIEWDGTNVSPFWTGDVNPTATNSTQEITAGSGVDHVQRAPGLNDHTMTFPVIYDKDAYATYKDKLVIGKQAPLIYGPEGNTVGKPKFEGEMILDDISGPSQTIDKQMLQFDLTFTAADEPTSTLDSGVF
jgi:hypothetical protein